MKLLLMTLKLLILDKVKFQRYSVQSSQQSSLLSESIHNFKQAGWLGDRK